ncbi:putative TolQ protein [Chlamydiales bacterium STE3]|nr:putative TolQ protein [Chlamydiales bacterium STE3]
MLLKILLINNPFFDSYIHSDFLGKLIFIGLIILSILSWIIIIYKTRQTLITKKNSFKFKERLEKQKGQVLNLDHDITVPSSSFKEIYLSLKKVSLELLNKNHHFLKHQHATAETSFLSQGDIDCVEAKLLTTVSKESKHLEQNLFILATIITLAPFLGLLGTVWGILTTFSELQAQGGPAHQTVLNGLSLALATTVLGLIDAIPALIGYNYLKNSLKDFETDMISFSRELLATLEMRYRKVDLN